MLAAGSEQSEEQMTIEGKRQSIPLTEGPSRAAARSYLRGAGYSKDDLHKPIIGIANTWTEIGTCNARAGGAVGGAVGGGGEAGGDESMSCAPRRSGGRWW